LMAQHENLDILGTIPASTQHQQVDHEPDQTVETGHAWILATSEPRRSCLRETAGHHAGQVFGTHSHVVNTTPRSKSRRCSTTRQPGSEFLSSTEPSPVSRRAPAWVESQPPPRGLGSRGLDSAPVRSPVDGLRDSRARTLRSRSMSMWFSRAQRSPASLTAQIDTPRVVRRRAYRTARGHLDRKFIRNSAENQARSNAGVAARPLSIASRDTRWEGGLDAPTRERDLRPVEGFDR
jgi:hypothetical protein